MTTRKGEEVSSPPRALPLAGRSLPARSHALQTAESLCRSAAHAAAQLEKRAQQCSRDGLCFLPPPPRPPGLHPHTWVGKSRAAPGSHIRVALPGLHSPSGCTAAQREGHAAHFRAPSSAQLSNHHLTLARVSRTREVHKPHQSPCFSPLPPPSCRSHHHQGISAEPARDQTRNAVEHQRCFSFTTFLMGQGCLSEPLWRPGLPWGASRERREAPAGMRSAQGSALPANAAGCRPASSHFKGCLAPRSTGGGKLCLPASCACQHVVHATHTPEGTGVPYSRPSEERVPVSPLVTEQHRQTSNHTNSHLHCLFL